MIDIINVKGNEYININQLVEELESRLDYGMEYAQAMNDIISILKRSEKE